jgi:hypothetical protein
LGAVTDVAIETLQPNATELVRRPRFAAADALHRGRVQRINLRTALMRFLVTNPRREVEQRAKAIFEHRVAVDLAANVTGNTAKVGAQELQFPPGTLELVRMGILVLRNQLVDAEPAAAAAPAPAASRRQQANRFSPAACELESARSENLNALHPSQTAAG